MSKKIISLLLLPLLFLTCCNGANSTPTVYVNVEWTVNKENGYIDVYWTNSGNEVMEWRNLDKNLNTVYAKWDGSNINNRFYDYHSDYYKLVVYRL